MIARRYGPAVALAIAAALAAALPSPAAADRLLWLTYDHGSTRARYDADRDGAGAAVCLGAGAPVSFAMQLDMLHDYASFTFGARYGTTRGRVRPWFEAGFGFSSGQPDWTGFEDYYGAGATVDVGSRMGLIVQARGLTSANFEYDEQLVEFHAGVFRRW